MPVKSDISITSATYNSTGLTITVVGVAFAENRYSGKVEYSRNGGTYTEVGGYTSWTDSLIVASVASLLSSGVYALRVTNGDSEVSSPLTDAFRIASGGGTIKWEDDREE